METDGETKFGQRFLREDTDVFQHNAWDNVDWPEWKQKEAMKIVEEQKRSPVDESTASQLLTAPKTQWEQFYGTHTDKFFMDRKWVGREFFPCILEAIEKKSTDTVRILEVGCGAGNTLFPLLELTRQHNNVHVSCSDFSSNAIDIIKANATLDSKRGQCSAFTWDITTALPPSANGIIEEGGLDFIIMIYVLSALKPGDHSNAIRNVSRLLKLGGRLLFKDYGRYDLTQLRFKSHRLINENFYCRGDGTLVYFFDADELDTLFTSNSLEKIQNSVDKRLIVNRRTKATMYRRWLQCIYARSTPSSDKKKLMKLCSEALRNSEYLEAVRSTRKVSSAMESIGVEKELAIILLHELLVSKRLNRKSGKLARSVCKISDHLTNCARKVAEPPSTSREGDRPSSISLPRYARINTLRGSASECLRQLNADGWEIVSMKSGISRAGYRKCIENLQKPSFYLDPHIENLLIFPANTELATSEIVEDGWLILQDKASCLPAYVLNVELGAEIVDACAAPGMKTSHAAALLENSGCPKRIGTLREMLKKFGVKNATVQNADFLTIDVTSDRFSNVEYAIVDPPCSGSGIVKRKELNSGSSTMFDERRLKSLSNFQSMLLKHALRLCNLKRLVYSTCSLSEKENENVIAEALEDEGIARKFELVDPLPAWKHRGSRDYEFGNLCLRSDAESDLTNGFFVALFQRRENVA